jgi:hypothetical protein
MAPFEVTVSVSAIVLTSVTVSAQLSLVLSTAFAQPLTPLTLLAIATPVI